MGRLQSFVDGRIDEKVNKKEIEEALKNDNILVGCEFEFKVDESLESGSREMRDLYDEAYDEVNNFNSEVDQYERDVEEYRDETQELRNEVDEFQERIDTLTDAIDDAENEGIPELESEIDELESEIEEWESEKEALESDVEDTDDKDEKRELRDQILDLVPKIRDGALRLKKLSERKDDYDNKNQEWQSEIDELERKIDTWNDDIKYREEDGMYEDIQTPYADEYSLPNYWQYMKEYIGYTDHELYTEPGEYVDEPPEPDMYGYDDFEDAVRSSGILDNAPFSDYDIGEYGAISQRVGDSTWAVENDSSLGDEGVEVKNPPMELPHFVDNILEDMFDWIGDIGYTDSDCGFHCHMSLKDAKGGVDAIKLILFTDEQWIFNAFDERASSSYTKSVKDKFKTDAVLNPKYIRKKFNDKMVKLKLNMNSQHFDGINILDLDTGHVEFRYMGGPNYHKKYKDVRATIATYAYNLSLAADPEFKKKEYILKLERIFNKMELYNHEIGMKAISHMKKVMQKNYMTYEDRDRMILAKDEKRISTRYNTLKSVYKLDGRTKSMIRSNTRYMQGVLEKIDEMLSRYSKKFRDDVMEDLRYQI